MTAAMVTTTEIAGFAGAGLAGVAYLPQLSRLIGTRCSGGISMLAQEVWLLASLLTTARAIAIHAGLFIVLGATQIVSTGLIMFFVTRYRDTLCPGPSDSPVQRRDGRRDRQAGWTGKARGRTSRLPSARPSTGPQPLRLPANAQCETGMPQYRAERVRIVATTVASGTIRCGGDTMHASVEPCHDARWRSPSSRSWIRRSRPARQPRPP
jgi:hypothetical protein